MKRRHRPNPLGFLVLLISLALMLGFPVGAGAGTSGATKKIDPALVQKLKDTARGSVTISIDDATSFASFIKAGRNGDLLPSVKGLPQGKAKGFIKQYGALLGVAAVDTDLVQTGIVTDRYGATHVTYEQRYRGLTVFGGVLKAHVDAAGNLTAVNGTVVPAFGLSTEAKLTKGQAGAKAIAAVVADPPGDAKSADLAGTLKVQSSELLVYRTGLVKGDQGTTELAYQIVVANGASVRDVVFVHAVTGTVINRYSLVDDALHRVLYESSPTSAPIWEEGDAFPGTLNGDQQNLVTFSGNAYWHFFNAFGRDSYDAAGAFMRTVNNDPTINCPNANWNGATTNYCNGVTSDDVVAHEWGHAYTEYTHNLIYQWQPGALNESYSDIWGETVDLINGLGTDDPGPTRTVGSCSSFSGARVVVINAPASIARTCGAGTAAFGPNINGPGITGDALQANDGVGATADACQALPAGSMVGKIAFVDRGTCTFKTKTRNAQDAGAIAVVIGAIAPGQLEFAMGNDATIVTPITIPTLSISTDNANAIRGVVATDVVNLTMKQQPPAGAEDSVRWLMGEDSTAFGGAIRDMWNPNCKADPGKVTDAEYHCLTADAGGVHTNSGVPNHGYALLVDGGTFNGRTVTGIGLVKAAHLYWRAQSVYQTPTSKFADHANALEASCTDLIGLPLAGLSTTDIPAPPSGQSFTAGDCAEVSDMIAAVELRTDPTQCNFGPALNPNTPAVCGPGQKNPSTFYSENFQGGLGGWTLSNQGVFSGWPGTNWAASSSLPGGRSGTAAFAAGPDAGNCDGAGGDISGAMFMESPVIVIPGSASLLPRVVFDQYFATEPAFDGGNVKIRINGGAYVLIPASAFLFNAYNGTMAAAPGNTSPLAGQPGFTGTDGGEVTGSWATSQINLSAVGVLPGDSIQLRFDFGRDGCGGRDGWYIDNVKLQSCSAKKQT